MAQIVADQLGDVCGGGHIADAPAGHGIGLGNTIDQQGAFLDLRADGGKADELLSIIHQMIIDLVADHVNILFYADLGDLLQLLAACTSWPGGVGGVVENHGTWSWG